MRFALQYYRHLLQLQFDEAFFTNITSCENTRNFRFHTLVRFNVTIFICNPSSTNGFDNGNIPMYTNTPSVLTSFSSPLFTSTSVTLPTLPFASLFLYSVIPNEIYFSFWKARSCKIFCARSVSRR